MYYNITMDCKTASDTDALTKDYSLLYDVYMCAYNNSKTPAEKKLLKLTFGVYLDSINDTPNIEQVYVDLNNTYTRYYMIYLNNITKCNIDNFNNIRKIVCGLMDKYDPSHSNSSGYYMALEDYLYDCKYGTDI